MKKVFVVFITLVLMATMVSAALGECILTEKIIHEDYIMEATDKVIGSEAPVLEKKHKDPNYIVTLGGDHLISVEVNHHPKVIQKISDGCHWVGQKISGLFHKNKTKTVTSDNSKRY